MATNVLELRRFDSGAAAPQARTDAMIRVAEDILSAARALARKVEGHGLAIMVWHDLSTLAEPVDLDGTPINAAAFGWSDEALAPWREVDRAMRSPLLRAARVAAEPLWMNRDGIRSRSANRLLDQIDLAEMGHAPSPAAGIVIPIHMPLGQVGAAILTAQDEGETDLAARFAASAAPLAPAIWQFITSYAGVARDDRYLPTESLLSPRELECLSWVAHGKTDYEISIILGCSHAGVRYHVTRACAKLRAVNRAQSVFRAAQLGYLGVSPETPRTALLARAN
ncbi:MAG: helix-turn-helix transcriptional regulator [Porphyrobacter sp.]|nr:helix-turn-helix transcriptional regulator [Porphyrobacter sp.]